MEGELKKRRQEDEEGDKEGIERSKKGRNGRRNDKEKGWKGGLKENCDGIKIEGREE